jgi:hypothetical protein
MLMVMPFCYDYLILSYEYIECLISSFKSGGGGQEFVNAATFHSCRSDDQFVFCVQTQKNDTL